MYSEKTNTEQIALKDPTLIDITWEIDLEHSEFDRIDSTKPGTIFFYKPVIQSEYIMLEGISLPQIKVQVEDNLDQIKPLDAPLESGLPYSLMDTEAGHCIYRKSY